MDTKMAPAYANIFMGSLEPKLIKEATDKCGKDISTTFSLSNRVHVQNKRNAPSLHTKVATNN